MNWAQIEEGEIKEKTAKEIRGRIAKTVEEEWREDMEKKKKSLHTPKSFYVCIYVAMCRYVFMHACMHVCVDFRKDPKIVTIFL